MFKVVSFFQSTKSDEYMKFLMQTFKIGMLGCIDNEKINNIEPLFYGWIGGKIDNNFFSFKKDNTRIDFKLKTYNIFNLKSKEQFSFPYPRNINDFICDCERADIDLHWSDFSIKTNEIKNIISIYTHKTYVNNLLEKIGKN